jgi:hypothetical protein
MISLMNGKKVVLDRAALQRLCDASLCAIDKQQAVAQNVVLRQVSRSANHVGATPTKSSCLC